jgi:valyl-tRNA synthetase
MADPEKGTGVLMVCTFGDATDVQWWREEGLALKQVIGRNGRLVEVEFGAGGAFPSLKPDAANAAYAELAGKNVKQAQARIVELLREPAGSATGRGAPLQGEPEAMEHPVKFYEKGDRPLEYVPTRQWFARLIDKKEALLAKGAEVHWHPSFMAARYRDWTDKLNLDWCLSRQRFFGVPIPVWYPLDARGEPDYDRAIVAEREQMPCDPTVTVPRGYEGSQRGAPGGFMADADIFDTWFTSSMTPQISSHWGTDDARHAHLFPADVRPQGHDIIRTWAFYTIAKALLHEDSVPWHHAMISGWILDPDRKKMSKSKGNVLTPLPLLDAYTADAGRYWAASARLGSDTAFDEGVWKIGKRLVTKLFNAGKFVLAQPGEVHPISEELDLAFVARLAELAEGCSRDYDSFHYAHALQETEQFFWTHFTDTYLELAKPRARWFEDGAEGDAARASGSAVAALRLGLSVLLRLFAPVLPYITEEVWSWSFAEETGHAHIHGAPWPGAADFADVAKPARADSFEVAVAALQVINKAKSDGAVSMGREVESLTLAGSPDAIATLGGVLADVLAAGRVQSHELVVDDDIEAGSFEVRAARFAPKPEKA